MKIKLNFEDFKLNDVQQLGTKGGEVVTEVYPTNSKCTMGDTGCCDSEHVDDEDEIVWLDDGTCFINSYPL